MKKRRGEVRDEYIKLYFFLLFLFVLSGQVERMFNLVD